MRSTKCGSTLDGAFRGFYSAFFRPLLSCRFNTDAAELRDRGVNRPFATITFDFALPKAVEGVPVTLIDRPRAKVS